ncbi:hypothetical protein R0K05_17320, partial [Planococcus sp. SIMBA_160]
MTSLSNKNTKIRASDRYTKYQEQYSNNYHNSSIFPHHRQEWEESAIARDIIEANLRSLKVEPYGARDEAIELLAPPDIKRDNTGRISRSELKKYDHLNDGGWYAQGFDLITGQRSDFLCLKPDSPRRDRDGKLIKYEHP